MALMKKILLIFSFSSILLLAGCKGNESQPVIIETDGKEELQNTMNINPGDYGPYGDYNKLKNSYVSISNKIRAITYYEDGESYVVVNDKKFGPYKNLYHVAPLKVSDNFWSLITYDYDSNSISSSKKIVYINGNPFELNNNASVSAIAFSDNKNSWGIRYFDDVDTKVIIDGGISTERDFYELNNIVPYQKHDGEDAGNYFVKYEGNEYFIGDNSDEGALFAKCMSHNKNKWGCSVGKKDGAWHIFIYENGVKKEYGPYGEFSDPRTPSEFQLSNDGFIFCSSNLAVVNRNGSEEVFEGNDIWECNYSQGNFGFNHQSNENGNDRMINVNGKEYGPYALIDNFSLKGNGIWGFAGYIKETDKREYIVNGEIISDINVITGPSISDNYWAVGYEKEGKIYMRIGGNKE